MKCSRLLFMFVLVIAVSATASADTLNLSPNNGSGDNFGYIGTMNGHQFILSGGVNPYFFFNEGYLPGSALGGTTELFLYSTTIWFDGQPVNFGFSSPSCTLFMTTFTLPINGQDFTVPVQIGFDAAGINPDTGQSINLGGSAEGTISFTYSGDLGLYYASSFTPSSVPPPVPEPGTLALLGTGMIGIIAAARRKL